MLYNKYDNNVLALLQDLFYSHLNLWTEDWIQKTNKLFLHIKFFEASILLELQKDIKTWKVKMFDFMG